VNGAEGEINPRDALAAKHFPKVWPKIATAPGKSKARTQYRKAAERAEACERLRAEGRSCASCDAFERKGPCGPHCLMDTDFYGYATTKADGLCHRWHAKEAAP